MNRVPMKAAPMHRTVFALALASLLYTTGARADEGPAKRVAGATAESQPAEAKNDATLPTPAILRPSFAEDGTSTSTGWTFGFHGYARMPLRTNTSFSRSPYLVDDNYYLSGFAYTRLTETEWAEAFFSAEHGKTRFVLGLFASQFSDWSEMTLQGQGGVATAFVEHEWELHRDAKVGLRAGMFWDRNGYLASYDTYLFGRMHVAGLRLHARFWDTWYLKLGIGAHAEVINANQGFTPAVWFSTGLDLRWLDVGLFAGTTWTADSKREFSIIKDGSLTSVGGEVRVAIPHVGPLYANLSFMNADKVVFLANGFEVLHSTGGRGLTQSFFGPDSANGTGQILAGGLELTWQLTHTLGKLFGGEAGRATRGLELRLFGMFAWVASKQRSEDFLKNFDNRVYYKWGTELFYRPTPQGWDRLFFALRYDRVILDTSHDSLAFRALTPKIGITPIKNMNLDLFFSFTKYWYGDSVALRPNQIPGDTSATRPDETVMKLQAQVSW